MTADALTLFARQLATWARQTIDNGRSPFRKVELSPEVQTEHGPIRPPLVFWINRQSLMAGGVLMLPPNRAEENLEEAAACARALGLRHFVCWAPTEIVFWETGDGSPTHRCKSIRLDGVDEMDIDRFRDELSLVMDELKLLSVTGSILPRELSEHYLANLCLGYLNDSLEKLSETFRIARGEGNISEPALEPAAWARQRGALSLFRLLALSYNDLLPDNVQPERLEQAMNLHLTELPTGFAPCSNGPGELPLPEDVAVRLHHLFRRLGQVGWRSDSIRALATVRQLMCNLGLPSGTIPLPDGHRTTSTGTTLLINTPAADLAGDGIHLVASPDVLAGAALERNILGLTPYAGVSRAPLDVSIPAESLSMLLGTLDTDSGPAPRKLRRKLEDSLRRSWPTRRFALPPRTPAWLYDLLHLLGLTAPRSRITLNLGVSWLDQHLSTCLFGLVDEQFTLTEVKVESRERQRVSLLRKPVPATAVEVVGPHGERRLPNNLSGNVLRSRILLALHLPDSLYRLIADEQFRIPDEDDWNDISGESLRLFASSSLGRGLWQIVDGRNLRPAEEDLADIWRQSACPLPGIEVLNHLHRLAGSAPDRQEIDEELNFWLGAELTEATFSQTGTGRNARRRATTSPDHNRLAEEIAALVFVDGIPRFPEHYLFDYYRPELEDFQITGPLRVASRFFNNIELEEPGGRRYEVEGDETAHAVVLASYGKQRTISLPVDRRMTGEILQRYRAELKKLRQQLVRETHARVGDSKSAAALVEQIWERHHFPPWDLIAEDVL